MLMFPDMKGNPAETHVEHHIRIYFLCVENWQSVSAGPRLTIRYIATTYDQEKWRRLSGARICKHLRSRGIDSKE
jgi:hypothetical protein